jgi:hypothetical protein
MMKLPELPQDFTRSLGKLMQDMIRAYGQACASAALERAAEVCESRYMGDNNREDLEARLCAASIRAEIAPNAHPK